MTTVTNIGRPTELQEILARAEDLQGRLFQAQGVALLIAATATAASDESESIAHSAGLLAEIIEEVASNLGRVELRKAVRERMVRTAIDAEGGAA